MITLTTILYEGNFEKTLTDKCWFFTFNSKLITNKLIVVNNLTSTQKFFAIIDELKLKYDFNVVFVDDNEETSKTNFSLDINKTSVGYYYTIPYFVLIDSIITPYVLNVATDCMDDIFVDDDFLIDGIKELDTNPLCSSVMISWVKDNHLMRNGLTVGQHEENETTNGVSNEKFNYTKGFTDQFFMFKTDSLRSINYNLDKVYSNTYNGPAYGGNSFEKRIVGHQNYNKIYNCVYKGNQYYIHDNHYY